MPTICSAATSLGMGQQSGHLAMQPGQPLGIQAIACGRALDFARHQPGIFEHLEVLGHGGLGEWGCGYDLTTDTDAAFRQVLDDPKANRIAERLQHREEARLLRGERKDPAARRPPQDVPCSGLRVPAPRWDILVPGLPHVQCEPHPAQEG